VGKQKGKMSFEMCRRGC